jgi:SAM-dependent methyltransferase
MSEKQNSPWYQSWFNEDYLEIYRHRDEGDAQRAILFAERELGLRPGDRVLDLCCGNGRHSVELARRGYRVTGLDLSHTLLRLGQRYARQESLKIAFVRADARQFPFHDAFDTVLNFFTSFGYFDADADNVAVLENIARVLRQGGRFLVDYLNADYVLKNFVFKTVWNCGLSKVRELRTIDTKNNRVVKTITIERDGVETRYYESVKLYREDDFRAMLEPCGLAVKNAFGDYDGNPADTMRPRLILIGEKV